MNFRMFHHKGQGGAKLVRVHEGHKTQNRREGTGGKHELDNTQIEMAVEQSRLELTRKGIEKEKET